LQTNLIDRFVNFLKNPSLTYSEICSFLVHNIFVTHKSNASLISHVSKSGLINITGSFGASLDNLASWSNIDPNTNHPVAKTLNENSPTFIKTLPKWPKGYSHALDLNIDENFKTFLCFPIARHNSLFGALSLFSTEILKLSKQDLEFYSIIANMVVLRFEPQEDLNSSTSGHYKSSLNEREIAIVDLIKLGKTNAEIAIVLGYSESTIRQDTIKIYRKLRVSGRQDIYFLKSVS
jgi:DNA-binding CsgD family transcriptional regulator